MSKIHTTQKHEKVMINQNIPFQQTFLAGESLKNIFVGSSIGSPDKLIFSNITVNFPTPTDNDIYCLRCSLVSTPICYISGASFVLQVHTPISYQVTNNYEYQSSFTITLLRLNGVYEVATTQNVSLTMNIEIQKYI